MIIFPSGEIFQASPEMLRGSPFHDFLLPGVILMVVNGVGQLVAGILSFRKHWFAGYAGAVFGLGLIIWIFVQVNMIGGRHIIQYSYFGLGVLETALSFLIQGWLSTKKQAVQPDIALHI
jgi:hypothetical protein